MRVYLNGDGTINKIVESRNFAGSDNANDLVLHIPIEGEETVKVNFILPNKSTYSEGMNREGDHWSIGIPEAVTRTIGQVKLSFVIKFPHSTLTTPIINLNIEPSVEEGD